LIEVSTVLSEKFIKAPDHFGRFDIPHIVSVESRIRIRAPGERLKIGEYTTLVVMKYFGRLELGLDGFCESGLRVCSHLHLVMKRLGEIIQRTLCQRLGDIKPS
jgi:hypothetical protein